jgi:hypothetical protein
LTSIRSEPSIAPQVHVRWLLLIRGAHTAAWISIESCVGYFRRAGATSGSVTDIYLPAWFARNLPAIHAPRLVLIGGLHGRTLYRRPVQGRADPSGPTIQHERPEASAMDAP